MRIGFDIDGVIYKFSKAYHLWLNSNKGMSLDVDIEAQTWDWFTQWETREEFFLNLHDAVDAGEMYWKGELYEPGIAQNLRDLRVAGHTIHIVTARLFGISSCAKAATEHFFAENSLIYDTLTIDNDKTSVATDIFLEDNYRNYISLQNAGIISYLVNRPYNSCESASRRVNSVDEFTKLILEDSWQRLEQDLSV